MVRFHAGTPMKDVFEIIGSKSIDKAKLMSLFPVLKQLDELQFYHPAHAYGVLDHSIKAAELVNSDLLKLVLIFHDVGKLTTATKVSHKTDSDKTVTKFPNHEAESAKIVNDLFKSKMEPKQLARVLKLIEYHDTPLIKADDTTVMDKFVAKYGRDFVADLLTVQRADMATHEQNYYQNKIKPRLDKICHTFENRHLKEVDKTRVLSESGDEQSVAQEN